MTQAELIEQAITKWKRYCGRDTDWEEEEDYITPNQLRRILFNFSEELTRSPDEHIVRSEARISNAE